jgi:hypothetical protein
MEYRDNEGKTQTIIFSKKGKSPECHILLHGHALGNLQNMKYLDKGFTFKVHNKALRTYIRLYSLFKTEQLGANAKLVRS